MSLGNKGGKRSPRAWGRNQATPVAPHRQMPLYRPSEALQEAINRASAYREIKSLYRGKA